MASARPPAGVGGRWDRKESSPQRVLKDLLAPRCPQMAGTQHNDKDSAGRRTLSPHPKSQDEVSPHKTKCKVSGILSSCSLPPLPHPAGSLLRLPVGRNNLCLSTSSPDPLRVLHSAAFRPPLDSTSSSSGSRDSPSATRPLPVSPVCENGTVFQQNTQTRVQRTILDSSSSPTHQS